MHRRADGGRGRFREVFLDSVGCWHVGTLSLGLLYILAGDACPRLSVGMRTLAMRLCERRYSKVGFVILESIFSEFNWYGPFGFLLLSVLVSDVYLR